MSASMHINCLFFFSDSKGNPRCTANSKGRKRKPGSRDFASAIKTSDPLFLDFIRRCLEWDQAARMTPEEALQHQWILEVCQKRLIITCVDI